MESWKQTIVTVVDLLTEDKVLAIICLTVLGCWALYRYPIADSLPIISGITGGICGFVTGSALNGGAK